MKLGALAMWLVLVGILVVEIWGFVDMPPKASANTILFSIFRTVFEIFAWVAVYNGNHFLRKVMGGWLMLAFILWLATATDINSGVSAPRAYAQCAISGCAGLAFLFLPQLRHFVTMRSERSADNS